MKGRKEVRLELEVLEDRMALNGAFGGAIGAGVPVLTPFNAWMLPSTSVGLSQPAVQNPIANFYNPTGQLSNALNQFQSFQAAQTALLSQVFSEMQSLLQALHINTIVML